MRVEVAQHASEDKATGVFITNVEDKVASFVEKTEVAVSLIFDEGYAANALGEMLNFLGIFGVCCRKKGTFAIQIDITLFTTEGEAQAFFVAAMTTVVSGCYDGEETLMKLVVDLSWSFHYA
ncbi:hypothetical protein V6N13_096051 [Hibiscus sabdariffa]|uniref:Uncharacterized protein n=1 Tax=Hibiscus sabdariffa TaxID=183260 RepID=A0ABR2DGV6_9ROSI